MKHNYKIGDKFKLSESAIENYGTVYENKIYTVSQYFNHYCKPENTKNDLHGHPGFDKNAESCLYEANGLKFALYEWEMVMI